MRLIPRTRLRRAVLALFCLLALLWVVGPHLLAPIVRSKLQKMVAAQSNARLEIGALTYMPPYGIRARDVRLIAPDPGNPDLDLLTIKELNLKLARLPIGSGPLVIAEIRVVEPSVHLVQTADGLGGQVSSTPAAGAPTVVRRSDMFLLRRLALQGGRVVLEDREHPEMPPMVWSDFSIDMTSSPRSKSAYDFQIGASHADLATMTAKGSFDIDDLWVQLDTFRTTAKTATHEQSAMPAQIQDVIEKYGLSARIDLDLHGRFTLLNPRTSVFDGSIAIGGGKATFPGVNQSIDNLDGRILFKRAPSAEDPSDTIRLSVDQLIVESAGSRLHVSAGKMAVDQSTGHWTIDHLTASSTKIAPTTAAAVQFGGLPGAGSIGGAALLTLSAEGNLPQHGMKHPSRAERPLIDADRLSFEIRPQGFTLWPKKYPLPIEAIWGGVVQKQAGTRVITFDALHGRYGADPVSLKSARMPLPADVASLKQKWRIEEIVGAIDFRQPSSLYPRGMDKVLRELKPTGRFAIGGGSWFEVAEVPIVPGDAPTTRAISTYDPREPFENEVADAADMMTFAATSGILPVARPRYKADYFFSTSADRLAFNLMGGRLPLTGICGDATFSPLSVRIERLAGELLGGTIGGELQVRPKEPFPFSGKASAREVRLDQLALALPLNDTQRRRLSGTAALDAAFEARWGTNTVDRLESIRAMGEFEVFDGHFWSLPVVNELLGTIGKTNDFTEVGEAAGRFEISGGTAHFQHVAICAPALGLIGNGTVGLEDKQLNLQVVAAPLGDWRDRLKRAKLPIVSDVGGEVAGAIQQVLNAASGAILYQLEVTGTTAAPQVRAVPAPALTEAAARLFSQMLNPDQHTRPWSATARRSSEP